MRAILLMHYIWQHIESIIAQYKGDVPLVHFLKNYYKQFPKLGSRDRRMLSEMAYTWYRCSKGFDSAVPFKNKMALCLRQCDTQNERLLQLTAPFLTEAGFYIENIFPFEMSISEGITREQWLTSMLVQPNLFIRVRKNIGSVTEILNKQEIPYEVKGKCIALPNGVPIDQWLPPYAYVVQDASSQQTGDYFEAHPREKWWDCCSGAGGKSLLLKDKEPLIDLTVSDTRKTILANLKERFRLYSHTMPATYELDMENANQVADVMKGKVYDNIICDVPCSGSGTWARTPEQLFFCTQADIERYPVKQSAIAENALKHLKTGGKLYYITCSVFTTENENVVNAICDRNNVQIKKMTIINGTEQYADSMFIAVLEKN